MQKNKTVFYEQIKTENRCSSKELQFLKKLYEYCEKEKIQIHFQLEEEETYIFESDSPGNLFPLYKIKEPDGTNLYFDSEFEATTYFIDKYEKKFSPETKKLADKLEHFYNSNPSEIDEDIFIEDIIENWNKQENVNKENLQLDISICEEAKLKDIINSLKLLEKYY